MNQALLLNAVHFMDSNECQTLISAASSSWDKPSPEVLKTLNKATEKFSENVKNRFHGKGEW